jgi:hypothetical protein
VSSTPDFSLSNLRPGRIGRSRRPVLAGTRTAATDPDSAMTGVYVSAALLLGAVIVVLLIAMRR